MKKKLYPILCSLLFCASCNYLAEEKPIDDYPQVGSNSIMGYDLTLNLQQFRDTYKDKEVDCQDDHVVPLSEGYYTSKFKYPIKTCHYQGQITVEFTDIASSDYQLKQFKKDYKTQSYALEKVLTSLGDSLGKRFTISAPTDLYTNQDARIYGHQRFHKGVLYIFGKQQWEGRQKNKDVSTAELGRIQYVNDQLENKIQDVLRTRKERGR